MVTRGGRAHTLTRLGWFFHYDGMYVRNWPLPFCVYSLEKHSLCLPYLLYCTITLQNLSTYIYCTVERCIVGASFFTHRHIYSLYCKTLAFAISLLISHNGEAMLVLQANLVFSTYTYLLQQKYLIRTYSTIPKWLVCIVRTVLSKRVLIFFNKLLLRPIIIPTNFIQLLKYSWAFYRLKVLLTWLHRVFIQISY